MSLLDLLSEEKTWADFYEYKSSLACPKDFLKELRGFMDSRAYLAVCETIRNGDPFPLPRKAVISKLGSAKKRTVYIYPQPENTVLKLLTHLMLRRYDALFDDVLYSFRPGRTAKDAIRRFLRLPGIGQCWSYKADIHNYFNSVPVDLLLPQLEDVLRDDPQLLAFLRSLLTEPHVLGNGVPVTEEKGIMAGSPLSSFFANLYLRELDRHFVQTGVPYARYSDDIILFGQTAAETEAHAAFIRSFLEERGLSLNPDKECFSSPEDGWTFLGFRFDADGTIDIAPATVAKLKQKMRRKARALQRWRSRGGLSGEKAASAFIRIFNRKLLEGPADNELTWSRWFFSVINTDRSLHVIDAYAQDCLRFLISGTRTKARFNARYEDLRELGYRSLVHAYYSEREGEKKNAAPDRI